MAAILIFPGLGQGQRPHLQPDAIPAFVGALPPTGVLGVAVTGLVCLHGGHGGERVVLQRGVHLRHLAGLPPPGTARSLLPRGGPLGDGHRHHHRDRSAFFAAGFSNISNYFQVLFGFLNVPLFTAFIIGMFWRRASASAGFWGILVGTASSITVYLLYKGGVLSFRSDLHESL